MDIINNYLNGLSMPETIIALVVGILLLIFGYRIKRMAFFIIWFILGYNLMNIYLMPIINSSIPDVAATDLWQILLPIAGGLLLALLGFSVEKICIAGICFVLTMMIVTTYFGTEMQTLAIGAVIGVIVGGVGVFLMKPTMIVVTALAGSYILTASVLKLSGIDPAVYYFPILIGSAGIGAIVQFTTTKGLD